MRYLVAVEFTDPTDRPPPEAMRELTQQIRANTNGKVRWVQRLDAIWCEECNAFHDGDREHLVD